MQRHWGNPNWDALTEHLQTVKKISISVKCMIKILLAFEANPVPPGIIKLLLEKYSRPCIPCVDRETLRLASESCHTNEETMVQLLNHISADLSLYASTALIHECAKLNNINVAKAIIGKYPEALNHCNQMGLRPIHATFSYQNRSAKRSDMVSLLLKEGSRHDIGGKNGCGGVFLQRELSNKSHASFGGSPIELALYYLRQKYSEEGRSTCDDEWKCLKVCNEIIKSSISDFHLINYIIKLNIGMERLIGEIVQRFDIKLSDTDHNGTTPLVVAIEERKPSYIRSILEIENCAEQVINCCVVNGNDYKKCLPLHIALNEGITWNGGLKEIWESNKLASWNIDPVTTLFPFMVAAQWKNNPLDDIYHLLQSNPGVVENISTIVHKRDDRCSIYYHMILTVFIGIIFQFYFGVK